MELLPVLKLLMDAEMSMNVLYYPLVVGVTLYLSGRFYVRLDKYNLKVQELKNQINNLENKSSNRFNRIELQVDKIETLVKEVARTVNDHQKLANNTLENLRLNHTQINTRLSTIEGMLKANIANISNH
jgi:hypothetical protein